MWYWVVMSFIVSLHVALNVIVAWPNKDYGFAVLFPLGIADYVIIALILKLGKKLFDASPKTF